MAHYLASQFSESCMVHNAAFTPEMIDEMDPDVVVLEVTERYCGWPYFANLKTDE